MEWWQAIVLGIVEGVTEFLPISSTFHLIWTGKLLGISDSSFKAVFDVVIQSGAILAVLLLYIRTLLARPQLVRLVLIAFVPTALIGAALYRIIKTVFFTTDVLMLAMFGLVGILFLVYEPLLHRIGVRLTRSMEQMRWKEAVSIGIVQALAVIPGVSRAGAVMCAMMAQGYTRADAAVFSFLLALPTILSAGILDIMLSLEDVQSVSGGWELIAIGMSVSFVSAYLVMRWFIRYLQTHSLALFGWYRLVILAILLLAGLLG